MRTISHALIRLYPARWRERYAAEFRAFLEDVPPGWRTNFDLLKGVIRMQLSLPSFPKVALVLSLLGLGLGLAASFVVAPRYISRASMLYQADSSAAVSNQVLADRLIQEESIVMSRTSLSNLIQDPKQDLYREERSSRPIDEVIETMKHDLHIRITATPGSRGTTSFEIAFTYRDPAKTQAAVQALVNRFYQEDSRQTAVAAHPLATPVDERIAALERRIWALEGHAPESGVPGELRRLDAPRLAVLDTPSFPMNPIYPNRGVFAATGFGAGFAAALLIVVFRRNQRPINALPNTGAIG